MALDNYGYKAAGPRRLTDLPLKALRLARRKLVYDFALLPYAQFKHRQLLRTADRTQSWTYTTFYRSPAQLELIVGPVMDFLENPEKSGKRLEVLLLACSIGAEPYTIASVLRARFPELDFHITASDLHEETVARAREGLYLRDEVMHCKYVTPAFLADTFIDEGAKLRVRPEVREKVTFTRANLLDGAALKAQFGEAPMVVAQNVLFHFAPGDAAVAFANLVDLTQAPGVLLVEGMDLDVREELTARHGLRPMLADLRRVYTQTRIHTSPRWWQHYWGTEPFNPIHKNKGRRYSTIFLKDAQV